MLRKNTACPSLRHTQFGHNMIHTCAAASGA
jgi:hypothetical protein